MSRLPVAVFALAVASLAATRASGEESMSHIEPSELLARIEAGDPPTVVDVRSRGEFESGHVPGAIHVPFWAALSRADEIPGPRDEPIVVYCEHGPRAGVAKAAFRLRGFEEVVYLRGHMTGWKRAGLPQDAIPEQSDPD